MMTSQICSSFQIRSEWNGNGLSCWALYIEENLFQNVVQVLCLLVYSYLVIFQSFEPVKMGSNCINIILATTF